MKNSSKIYALPAHMLPGSRAKLAKGTIDGFRVSLRLVSAKAAATFDKKTHRSTEARIGDRMYPALTPHFGIVTYEHDQEGFAKLSRAEQHQRNCNVGYVKRVAHEYSRLTGVAVHLHSMSATRQEPLPAKPNEVHVLFGMIPSGSLHRTYDLSMVFGQMLDTRAQYYSRILPAKGRGVVQYEEGDKDKKALVQVVDRTAYMLMPVLGLTNQAATEIVFRGLLQLVHQALPLAAKHKAKLVTGSRMFNACYRDIRKEYHDWRKERDKETALKVETALKDYLTALEDLRSLRLMSQFVDKGDSIVVRGLSSRGDFERIRNMPEIDRIECIDGGLHIVTRHLSAVHEGRAYRLGRYVIRLGDNEFTLFCEESSHPEGKIHPHFPNDGTPCWGNAGVSLARAQSEGRLADLVDLVIKWLTQGYEPTLAETKIEEWPIVVEVK